MTKYYLTSNNKEVKMGETVTEVETEDSVKYTTTFTLTPNNVHCLEEMELIYSKEEGVTNDLSFYIAKISERMDCDYDDIDSLIEDVAAINPMCAASMLLKEISKECMKTHNEIISLDDTIYIYNNVRNQIVKVTPRFLNAKGYEGFAYFTSLEDAERAVELVQPYLKEVFGE